MRESFPNPGYRSVFVIAVGRIKTGISFPREKMRHESILGSGY